MIMQEGTDVIRFPAKKGLAVGEEKLSVELLFFLAQLSSSFILPLTHSSQLSNFRAKWTDGSWTGLSYFSFADFCSSSNDLLWSFPKVTDTKKINQLRVERANDPGTSEKKRAFLSLSFIAQRMGIATAPPRSFCEKCELGFLLCPPPEMLFCLRVQNAWQ